MARNIMKGRNMVYQGLGKIDETAPIMKELMPASEARRIVDNGEDEKTTKLWNELVDEINQAIQDGKKNYSKDGDVLPRSIINRLQLLGYRAVNGSQYNESYYIISW